MFSQYNQHSKSRKRDKRQIRKEENISLFSVCLWKKIPQRAYRNAIISNRLQDSKSVYKN